jgi:uncharacterized protein (DUF427 family)
MTSSAFATGKSPGFAAHPDHEITFEPSPKRVRVGVGETVIADTIQARLLRETGHMPVYYIPRQDVRMGLLSRTDHTTHCPFKGEASYWSVAADGRVRKNLVWSYERPYDEMPQIAGYLAFDWDAVDHRWEEDEEVFGHPRDPYHRIDVRPSSRRVEVVLGGETVADSRRALFLFETGLPTRYYLPHEDVRTDLLSPTDTTSVCPYKGTARYWTAEVNGGRFEDIVWAYPEPLPEQPRIKDRLCFFNEKVDALRIEGEPALRNEAAKERAP